MCTLAIDIGGTKIAVGLVTNGQLTSRKQFPTPTAANAADFARQILEHCQPWLASVDAIGVSTTGLVSKDGISAINPDTLAFPTPFPLADCLKKQSGKPVAMLNDAQAAAWYEYKMLAPDTESMAFITVSTGVGGGIVINRQLHKGNVGLAGHVGHSVIDNQGPACGCGQTGCVEAIASGTAIKKASDAIFSPAISNIELFELAGDNPQAEAIIARSADAIATLCCNLKATLDLDIIVLGGGVGLARGYIERVNRAIQQRPSAFQIKVVPAQGDYDACLLGAAYQFMD